MHITHACSSVNFEVVDHLRDLAGLLLSRSRGRVASCRISSGASEARSWSLATCVRGHHPRLDSRKGSWWFRRRADGVGETCDAFGGVRACSGAMQASSVSVLRDIIAFFHQCVALRRLLLQNYLVCLWWSARARRRDG